MVVLSIGMEEEQLASSSSDEEIWILCDWPHANLPFMRFATAASVLFSWKAKPCVHSALLRFGAMPAWLVVAARPVPTSLFRVAAIEMYCECYWAGQEKPSRFHECAAVRFGMVLSPSLAGEPLAPAAD